MTRLTGRDLIIIALIAALSIAVKPYIRAPFGWVQTVFHLPVGVFIGGLYMFWPVLGGRLVPRFGAVFITCLLQGVLAVLVGFTGLLGPAAFLSYLAPGIVIEALYLASRRVWGGRWPWLETSLAGALGNAAGAATNAYLFFALTGSVFTLAVGSAMLTGALGGWLAYLVGGRLARIQALGGGQTVGGRA